jgi:hypothetical protein
VDLLVNADFFEENSCLYLKGSLLRHSPGIFLEVMRKIANKISGLRAEI